MGTLSKCIQSALLSIIRFYQRYLSKYKGFSCAYRHHTGCASCSQLGLRAVRRYGAWRGLSVTRLRLKKCGVAYRRYSPASLSTHFTTSKLSQRYQAGFCDIGGCDIPVGGCDAGCDGSDIVSGVCDGFSNCGSCDWPSSGRKREEDKYVYIPPKTNQDAS